MLYLLIKIYLIVLIEFSHLMEKLKNMKLKNLDQYQQAANSLAQINVEDLLNIHKLNLTLIGDELINNILFLNVSTDSDEILLLKLIYYH